MIAGCGKAVETVDMNNKAEQNVVAQVDTSNDVVVAVVDYNPDVNSIPKKLDEKGLMLDEIATEGFTIEYTVPEGFDKDYQEVYADDEYKDYYSKGYITDEFVMADCTVFNYSDMGATAETTIINDVSYENSEIKNETIDGVKYYYAVRYSKNSDGKTTGWIITCDLPEGWIYQVKIVGLDLDREIEFEEIKNFMNIAIR